VKGLPIIKGKIQEEVDKNAKGVEAGFQKGIGTLPYIKELPKKGLSEVLLRYNKVQDFSDKIIQHCHSFLIV